MSSDGSSKSKIQQRKTYAYTNKCVFDLVIDFGTSQSPKSTQPLTTYLCPSRPGHRVWMPTLLPLWRYAHDGQAVRPRGYWGLPAFASLSMAGSERLGKLSIFFKEQCLFKRRKEIIIRLRILNSS